MRWEMDAAEVEAVLERIWDLHDKVSDAIHAVSRATFLTSIKTKRHPSGGRDDGRAGGGGGFVFVKDFGRAEDDAVAMAEASSLNAIRTALENLEDQLEFFHICLFVEEDYKKSSEDGEAGKGEEESTQSGWSGWSV